MISSCLISKYFRPSKNEATLQREPSFSHAAMRSFTRRSIVSYRARSVAAASMPAVMSRVTSTTDVVTNTRDPGPFGNSSASVGAKYPFVSRFRSGVELNCRPPVTQWWFVTIRPSGDTKDAVQPPRDTMAPIGWPVRSANDFGSPVNPRARSFAASAGICWGIHMPSSATTPADNRTMKPSDDDA